MNYKKSLKASVLAVCVILSCVFCTWALAVPRGRGDVNGDGTVSNTDLIKTARHVVDIEKLTGEELKRADINNDGQVNNEDIILTARRIVGLYDPGEDTYTPEVE